MNPVSAWSHHPLAHLAQSQPADLQCTVALNYSLHIHGLNAVSREMPKTCKTHPAPVGDDAHYTLHFDSALFLNVSEQVPEGAI